MANTFKKIDARSRWQLEQGAQHGPIEIFLRLDDELTSEQRKALDLVGCHVRSEAGDIVTAVVDASNLPGLAELSFVQSIQFSRQLFEDRE